MGFHFLSMVLGFFIGSFITLAGVIIYNLCTDSKSKSSKNNYYTSHSSFSTLADPDKGSFQHSHNQDSLPGNAADYPKQIGTSTSPDPWAREESAHSPPSRLNTERHSPPPPTKLTSRPTESEPEITDVASCGQNRNRSFGSRVVDAYNKAVLNEDFGAFRMAHQIKRVGPYEGPSETVRLIEKNDGDYYAIPEPCNGWLVLPRLGIALADFHYGPGKMGNVFDCPGFDPALTYDKVKVISAAKFRWGVGHALSLLDPGQLDLGGGKQV